MSKFNHEFAQASASFVDRTNASPRNNLYWPPVVIKRAEIEREIERLASLPRPGSGRRSSLIVHPASRPDTPGLAPGIQVALSVLLPGEQTRPFRHNATEVNFCIRGSGCTTVGERRIRFGQYDVWNHPSYTTYSHLNDGSDLQARLTYSNTPLLQHMEVHVWEDDPGAETDSGDPGEELSREARQPPRSPHFSTLSIGSDGAMLMPYETLINPPSVHSPILHWPWISVEAELEKLMSLGKRYVGRRLYLLYNPMTGRTNGTTPSFFATMTIRPEGIVDRPHRHVSAAINYYFRGAGWSMVAGNRYEWEAGDLMLSAPGWAVHNHASRQDRVYELTVQDQPLNILMESLLWQEDLKKSPRLLGSRPGFQTNRPEV